MPQTLRYLQFDGSEDGNGLFTFEAMASVGAFGFGLSQVYFLFAVVLPTIRGGAKAPAKPWEGAEGLEWTVPSPAPFHTFETPPLVK